MRRATHAGRRRSSLSRTSLEFLAAIAALTAILLALLAIPHFGSRPEPVAAKVELDPALLRSATKTNPCTAGKVALTFDDGPDVHTEPMLELLRAYGVKATFFVLGAKVSQRPQTVRTAIGDGHLVENHSWDHPHLADLTAPEINAQITRTQQAVRTAGAPAPTMLRAPFNSLDDRVRQAATAHGLKLTQWDIDTNDWRGRRPEDITNSVVSQLRPGAVVLLHDGIQDSGATLNALPAIIEGIRSRGYCTATLT
ncbi:polysaccharide deacetylase family protein [Actinoplanes sp. NPDC049599]|uniref:polysaccharide deacetylase family protein n=1 Tax=Actinoplanes sp. NPDC049599 TaxID=3363903 RepID=UPI0037B3E7C6